MTLQANPIAADHYCAHCTLPVPAALVETDAAHQFCCPGCRAVYQSVTACGLGEYYRLRDAADAALKPASPGTTRFEAFDSPAFANLYIEPLESGLVSTDLHLEGVSCAACVWLVERLPSLLPGVVEARLALRRSTVRVTWNPQQVRLSQIATALDRFGYTPHPLKGASREQLYRKEFRARLIKLGAAGAIMGNLMLLGAGMYAGWAGGIDAASSTLLRVLTLLLGVLSLAWPGYEFFRSAFLALRHRSINLDVPICIALATGGIAGIVNVFLGRGELYFDSLSALVFLLLVGRFLQFRQQRRAENSVELLYSLTPQFCRVVDEAAGTVSELPIESLRPGHLVEVLPNHLIPADGTITTGTSTVDQALLTGESAPAPASPGTPVFGGSQNGPAPLRIRIERAGEASRVGRLMRLLERSLSEKPEIVRFSDRVGEIFTVAVTLGGAAVFTFWSLHSATSGGGLSAAGGGLSAAIDHTVAFLIVTCPCVLGLATPMTLTLAIGQLARRDILVKSGAVLEKLARASRQCTASRVSKPARLILDKTGTLTTGRLRVLSYEGPLELRGLIARLEQHSSHPVAKALRSTFESYEPPARYRGPLTTTERPGGGIIATLHPLPTEPATDTSPVLLRIGSPAFLTRQGIDVPDSSDNTSTTLHLTLGDRVCATVTLGDSLRPGTHAALSQLRHLGFAPEIRSGDAPAVVRHIARELDIPPGHAFGNQSPEAKLATLNADPARPTDQTPTPTSTGLTVMVGDGVNDAAALAAASIGIAAHGGAEASLAAADVYLARPGLEPLVDLVRTARRTMTVIHRNFAVSLAYNLLAGTLAATGHMNPLIAAILMPLSSATVLTLAIAQMKRADSPHPR